MYTLVRCQLIAATLLSLLVIAKFVGSKSNNQEQLAPLIGQLIETLEKSSLEANQPQIPVGGEASQAAEQIVSQSSSGFTTLMSVLFTSAIFSCSTFYIARVKNQQKQQLVELHKSYKTQFSKVYGDLRQEMEHLKNDIVGVRKYQKNETDKNVMGISQLWSEVYRLKNEQASSAIAEYSTSTATTSSANRVLIPRATNSSSKPYTPRAYVKPTARNFPVSPIKKANLLKTEFGTFDISTNEGRQQWIKAINEKNKESESSPDTLESAKIEFIIPKLENRENREKINSTSITPPSSTNSNSSTDGSSTQNTSITGGKSTTIALGSEADRDQPAVVVLTYEEIKAKLEESAQKNYRRVFIPGRGWVSLRKLQEEADMMVKNGTCEAVTA